MRIVFILLSLGLLSACAGRPDLSDERLSAREFNLEEFFDGQVVGYGQFQDRFGTVRRRFEVQVAGDWDGRVLTLDEDFTYEDGSTETRVWTLTKTGDQTWQGTAPGVIGLAMGEERGDAFNWRYTIDLPVPDGTLRVSFDDWMWQMKEGRVLNRAYMDKFGVEIGEVIIWFEKQGS
ncbi:ketosteroid isomerase-like protein [Roseovarius sp. MBR-51]